MYEIAIGSPSVMFDASVSFTHDQTYKIYVWVDDSCVRKLEWIKNGWFGGAGVDMSVDLDKKSAWPSVTPGITRSIYMAEKYTFESTSGCDDCTVTFSREENNTQGVMNFILDIIGNLD